MGFILYLTLVSAVTWLAHLNDRSPVLWFLYAFFIPPLAVPHMLGVEILTEPEEQAETARHVKPVRPFHRTAA